MPAMNMQQRLINSILEETGVISVKQVHKLLSKAGNGREMTEEHAGRVIKQLRCMNKACWINDDVATRPQLRQKNLDCDMLAALDVMVDLLDTSPLAVSAKKMPFKLSFLIEQEEDILPFGICTVEQGKESTFNFKLSDRKDISTTTVIFLISDIQQKELLHTDLKHYFALTDNGRMRYFKSGKD